MHCGNQAHEQDEVVGFICNLMARSEATPELRKGQGNQTGHTSRLAMLQKIALGPA